jgi:hypothetical protein
MKSISNLEKQAMSGLICYYLKTGNVIKSLLLKAQDRKNIESLPNIELLHNKTKRG